MTKFNKNATTHKGAKSPLFLGEQLGVVDTININYPQLDSLYKQQVSQIWNEDEVSLAQDKIDMLTLPRSNVDLMVKILMWQTVGDTIVSRSISDVLNKYITNSEMEAMVNAWSFFEVIHTRTYSHIIKQTFADPNDLLTQLYNETEVLQRSDIIIDTFDKIDTLPRDASVEEVQDAIIEVFTALFAMEAIAFMSSFAVTFAIVEKGYFAGIGKLVTLICRDEVLHTRMSYEVVKILKSDPVWDAAIQRNSGKIQAILDDVVRRELAWADYLFSDGREIIGLNANRLKNYTKHMAKPVYDAFGVSYDGDVVIDNPIPYMDNYTNQGRVQTAAQELQLTNYRIGIIEDDSHNLNFEGV